MSQDDLPHMYVFLVEGVTEFDALQLIGPFLSLLYESVSFLDIADLVRVVLIMLFS